MIDRVCTLTGLKEDSCAWAGLSTAECAGVTAARGCGLIPFTGKILIGFVPSVGTQKEATQALGKGAFPGDLTRGNAWREVWILLGECNRVALVRSLEMVEEVADADCKTMQTARWFFKLTEQVSR